MLCRMVVFRVLHFAPEVTWDEKRVAASVGDAWGMLSVHSDSGWGPGPLGSPGEAGSALGCEDGAREDSAFSKHLPKMPGRSDKRQWANT